jgi:glycosyltransferase involved in cell wall biosynthesis
MVRFVGIKHNRICLVSDQSFHNDELHILPVPKDLEYLSDEEIITTCHIRNDQVVSKRSQKPMSEMRVAFVGNWKQQCGIASFNHSLWSEIAKHIKEFKLFVETIEKPIGDILDFQGVQLSSDQVVQCWQRGKSLQQLSDAVKEYQPDIVLISHEWGLFPQAMFWLSFLTQLSEYRIIVNMHSVYPHHYDKIICEAAIPEIVVHLEAAKDNLTQDKGIVIPVSVIPHGCDTLDKSQLWNFYQSEHTFIQSGFGFRYKNFEHSIRAAALLKEKYSDVFFTAVFSESPHNQAQHQLYYNQLIDLVEQLGLQNNVAIVRGYQSEAVMKSYLKTNKVAVFPYASEPQHLVYGASGSARTAFAANICVISSNIPHFSDLPTIKAETPEEIAKHLDRLFSDPVAVKTQLDRQHKHLIEYSWAKTGEKYAQLFGNG